MVNIQREMSETASVVRHVRQSRSPPEKGALSCPALYALMHKLTVKSAFRLASLGGRNHYTFRIVCFLGYMVEWGRIPNRN